MATIGIYYGSSTGNTEFVADSIAEAMNNTVAGVAEVFDIALVDVSQLADHDFIVIGCPTWNIGKLQDDWEDAQEEMVGLNLSGKKVAIFGLGDQFAYPVNYCDAIGILGNTFRECGAELVAFTELDANYAFAASRGVENGQFMGLAIDEESQSELTEQRVASWVPQVLSAFGLS